MTLSDIKMILQQVTDPEIPVITISDLGILQDVQYDTETQKVVVTITPTYTGCPAMDMINVNVKSALQEVGLNNVEVILTLEPIWTTDWITEEGRAKLKAYGIAPPVEKTNDPSFLTGKTPDIACPQCGSTDTVMISRFGSTACKSLYKCNQCLEPFDYFKCH